MSGKAMKQGRRRWLVLGVSTSPADWMMMVVSSPIGAIPIKTGREQKLVRVVWQEQADLRARCLCSLRKNGS